MRAGQQLALELGFFFAWLLTVPLFGPLLQRSAELRGTSVQPHLFMLVHAITLVGLGMILNRTKTKRPVVHAIRYCVLLCALFTIAFFWAPPSYQESLLGLMAIPSSLYILLWVERFVSLDQGQRPSIMVLAIFIANVVYVLIQLLSPYLGLAALTLLATTLLLVPALRPRRFAGEIKSTPQLPTPTADWRVLLKFCLAVVALYVVGGLYYTVTRDAVESSSTWGPIFLILPYLLGLGGTLWVIKTLGLRSLAILSAAVLGIGYGLSALPPYPGSMLLAFALIQAALAGFDVFVWVGLAEYCLKNLKPVGVYGWGLGANVTGLLAGSFLATSWLARTPKDIITNSALAATLVLFVSIVALVELPPRPKGVHEEPSLVKPNNTSEVMTLPPHLSAALTPRQLEVANLMLRGLENKEIEQELYITANTTKSHIRQVYRRLEVHNRQELLLLALKKQGEAPGGSFGEEK